MSVKKHMAGGSLRVVMAQEIRNVLHMYQDDDQKIVKAALHLGITPKTLRQWCGPIDKGGWEELQIEPGKATEVLMKAVKGAKKMPKKPVKKATKGKTKKSSTAVCY